MKPSSIVSKVGVFAVILSVFTACEKEVQVDPDRSETPSSAGARFSYDDNNITFFALAGGTQLDKLSTILPGLVLKSVTLTGLQTGEKVLGIDFRPATGQLYGLGSTSRLYVINPETGVARMIGAAPFAPALMGTNVGFDFNPTVDRIRVVTSQGQNLRLNPETGAVVAVDGPINITGKTGSTVAAVAYTNNVAGATTTTLYDIDPMARKLYRQDPPNAGTLVEVGSLRLNITGEGGFDIAPDGDNGLALFEVDKRATLFSVDLKSGSTRLMAKYAKMYTALAIPTRPVAYAVTAANRLLIFDPSDLDDGKGLDFGLGGNVGLGGIGANFGLGLNVGDKKDTVVYKAITGLLAGETVLGIDFRPLNGQLYALGSMSRIYTVNTATGGVTLVGTLSTPLAGTQFGFDFNPVVDRIRIVSNTGQNLRFNPNDGAAAVLVDGALNPATTGVSAAAYANNFAGTTATMLFDIDVNTDKLYLQNPPNNGTLVEVGRLGVNVEAANGFDIGGTSKIAYALLTSDKSTKLYTINTTTGAAKAIGNFGTPVNGFAIGLGF